MKRIALILGILMLFYSTCLAKDSQLSKLYSEQYLFWTSKYQTVTNAPKLPFSNMEAIHVSNIDVKNKTYTLTGESAENVVAHTKDDPYKTIRNLITKICLPASVKNKVPDATEEQWLLIKLQQIDCGFTYDMVVLAKGLPEYSSTNNKISSGTLDDLQYPWGSVILLNNHVIQIND